MQVLQYRTGLLPSILSLYGQEGVLGFYRGFQATLQREIPFSCVQFPLYEALKWRLARDEQSGIVIPWQAALCGSVAGGITALLTTPLDVIKTRTILSESLTQNKQYKSPLLACQLLFREGGLRALFAGALPRLTWISLGGFIFFGAYETCHSFILKSRRDT